MELSRQCPYHGKGRGGNQAAQPPAPRGGLAARPWPRARDLRMGGPATPGRAEGAGPGLMRESLTEGALRALDQAQARARHGGAEAVEPTDLLAALIGEAESRAAELLSSLGL